MDNTLPGFATQDETELQELVPLTVIRTETALSRFPVHRIAKKGTVRIELKHQASAFLWKVSYSSEHGQPGPLAYKLDTLVVNRRIEEATRPLPKFIPLGSLRDIALEIGAGEKNTQTVKQALLQNAFANITAKISYRAADRSERTLEAAFTRYSIVFTGETLPNGKNADGVYLVLNDIYMEVLNAAITRPLDYDYMKALPPAAQRFYEIVSYQIYAALLHENERAKLRYSEYCLLSTATRYFDFDHVKKQMYKIHLPHLDNGYLARVSYEETTDDVGKPDWFMWYTPGLNATRQYHEFSQTGRRPRREKRSKDARATPATLALSFGDTVRDTAKDAAGETAANAAGDRALQAETVPNETGGEEAETAALVAELIGAGLNRTTAAAFARERAEECRRQLVYLAHVTEFKTSRGAYLRRAIEQGFAPPAAYQKRQDEEAEQQRKRDETAARNARKTAQEARRAAEAVETAREMARLEKDAPEAFAGFLRFVADAREQTARKHRALPPSIQKRMLDELDTATKRQEMFQAWRALPETQRMGTPNTAGKGSSQKKGDDDPEAVRALLAARFTEREGEIDGG